MTNTHLPQVLEALVYISNDISELLLFESFLPFNSSLNVPFFTELSDDIAFPLLHDSFMKLNYVGVFEFPQYTYLFHDKGLEVFMLRVA